MFDTPETALVAEILAGAGFNIDQNTLPTSSRNPDLLVRGRLDFWAEVKALADPLQLVAMGRAHDYFKPRLEDVPFAADLHVDLDAAGAEYRRLCQLIVAQDADIFTSTTVFICAKADESKYRASYELEMQDGSRQKYVGFLRRVDEVVVPWWSGEPRFGQQYAITIDGITEQRVLRSHGDTVVIGARLRPAERGGLFSTGLSDGAWESTDMRRIRRDVAKANRQISSACATESLAGVVFLVGRISERTLAAAMLGDLTVTFSTSSDHPSRSFYGRNGIFRPRQNTHVSCVYSVRSDAITFIGNPFAQRPIDNFLPSARAIAIDSDGTVTLP
jgi:hypothetical protein